MGVKPSSPSVSSSEGGGGGGGGGGGDGSDSGMSGDVLVDYNGDGLADSQAMVCFELASGNLQRNVTVNVMTIPSNTSTGTQYNTVGSMSDSHTNFISPYLFAFTKFHQNFFFAKLSTRITL